jgi:hypothetical protein
MAPVHQAVAPAGVGHIALGPLRHMAMNIADNLPHMGDIVIGEFGFWRSLDFDDAPPGLVSD